MKVNLASLNLVLLVLVGFAVGCAPTDDAFPTLQETRMAPANFVKRIEVVRGGRVLETLSMRWITGTDYCGMKLPYSEMVWGELSMWDAVPVAGVPTLLVMEYVPGGSASWTHQWAMRIFLLEGDDLRELPAILGAGGVYYFKDFNGDGSLEFVNTDGVGALERREDGVPISPHVYEFNGVGYRATGGWGID